MIRSLFFCLLLLTGCGYHVDSGDKIAISVPYAIGDHEGELTDALIWAVARTGNFSYASSGGDWVLKTKVLGASNDRIGFRYDRDDKSGKLRKNIVGTENRKQISVEVHLVDRRTDETIVGPQVVKADVDYDYVDSNSLRDLAFVDTAGDQVTSIAFSLGQLDSVGGAGEDALYPLYRIVAQKIVDGLIASGNSYE